MAQTFIGRKRIRKRFGHIADAAEMPNLIEVQKQSYDQFLMVQDPVGGRPNTGLQAVFASIFPIKDFSDKAQLEFVRYDFEPPKYDVDECQQRSMTYAAPLKVKLRLISFDVNEETGSRSVRDIKEQDVYMGDIPFMTLNGTFVINGTERVIVSQMHRSPGVFFHHDGGKSHSSGKLLFAARIIPYRGSWLDFEFDAKDIVYARIDRKRKLPATTLLYALGMDNEEILGTFYKRSHLHRRRAQGWRTPFVAERMRGVKTTQDIYDADTGEVVIEAGKKLNARAVRQLSERVKAIAVPDDALLGRYLAEDIVNMSTGEIYAEAGGELDAKVLDKLRAAGIEELPVLDIDHVSTGSFIRNTLHTDKNQNGQDALFDIYRVMRPGEPPTEDAARALFKSLFFDEERYDLSSVGRVKMNIRLEIEQSDEMRILTKEDIISVIRTLVDLRDGRGEVDDIDNLGNRRVRSVGELMENQYRLGLLRMERAIRERMSSVDIDTVMPQDLINAKPASAAVREFFGSSQLSQFMDQTNPLSEITHKRRLSALGPGGLTRERAGFEVRDVHPTHYGRICPIETPEGPNIGLINSLATFARVNKYGFIESPYRRVVDGKVTDKVVYLSAMEEARYHIAQANVKLNPDNTFAEDLIICRHQGDVSLVPHAKADFIDVSPKQVVSVAAALIPFLENDDANRALMGSNMQRQAVPLLRAEAPLVGTGMESVVARDSGAAIGAKRAGIIDQVDATRIVIRATDEADPSKSGVDIYNLRKFQRSNQNTCINQRPLVRVGDRIERGDIIADGPSTDLGDLALGKNVLVAFMPWQGYNFEDFDPALRAYRLDRRVHLDPHRGIRGFRPRHQARTGGNHARHSERVGRGAEEPRRSGHRLYRGRGPAGRYSGRQDHAERREPDDAGGEAAPRHLRREGLRRSRYFVAPATGRRGHRRGSARLQPAWRRERRARHGHRARGDRAARQGPRRRIAHPRQERLRPLARYPHGQGSCPGSEGLEERHGYQRGTSRRCAPQPMVGYRAQGRAGDGRHRGDPASI